MEFKANGSTLGKKIFCNDKSPINEEDLWNYSSKHVRQTLKNTTLSKTTILLGEFNTCFLEFDAPSRQVIMMMVKKKRKEKGDEEEDKGGGKEGGEGNHGGCEESWLNSQWLCSKF